MIKCNNSIIIANAFLILYYIIFVLYLNFVAPSLLRINMIVQFIVEPLLFLILYYNRILNKKFISFVVYFNCVLINLIITCILYTAITQLFIQNDYLLYLNRPMAYNFIGNMRIRIWGVQIMFPIVCIVKIIGLIKNKSKIWRLQSLYSLGAADCTILANTYTYDATGKLLSVTSYRLGTGQFLLHF